MVYGDQGAAFVLIQPVDDHDMEEMEQELACIRESISAPFLLATVPVQNWNQDLSPWPAPPVFGKEGFGDGASAFLRRIQEETIPHLQKEHAPLPQAKYILGGYSLAGLFALWACHTLAGFDGVAAASPSVWFPGFLAFAKEHPLQARAVYLSLGDREEKTRNPVMAQVGECIRTLYAHYDAAPGLEAALEWNPGNHFRDAGLRTAKAFAWVMERLL